MMPPTIATLRELAEYATAAEVLAAADSRDIAPVLPRVVVAGKTWSCCCRTRRDTSRDPACNGFRWDDSGPARGNAQRVGDARPQSEPDDPRRHQHLAAARRRRRRVIVIDAGPAEQSASPRVAAAGRGRAHPAHPRPPRSQRRLGAAGRAHRRARARARPPVRRAAFGGRLLRPVRGSPRGDRHPRPFRRLAVVLPARRQRVLTGDTILGRGTTVVAWPDGELGPYLESLQALREYGDAAVLPGHGPELPSAGRVAEEYLAHREDRLAQVAKAVGRRGAHPAGGRRDRVRRCAQVLWPGPSSRCMPSSTTSSRRPHRWRTSSTSPPPRPTSRCTHGRAQPRRCCEPPG